MRKSTIFLILFVLTIAVSVAYARPGAPSTLNNATDFTVGDFIIQVETSPIELVVLANGREQWRSQPGSAFIHAGDADLIAEENRGSFLIEEELHALCTTQTIAAVAPTAGTLTISGQLSGDPACTTAYTVTFVQPIAGHLAFDISFDNPNVNYSELAYAVSPTERFHGFGEQFTLVDLKGNEVPILSQEGGVGRGQPLITPIIELGSPGSGGTPVTTYYAVPHYITSDYNSLFLENTEYSVFDLTNPASVNIRHFSPNLRGRILAADSYLDQITRFTEYSGRMQPLPDWAHDGAIVGMQGGTAAVEAILDELEARETPIAAFWLQDWVGKRVTLAGSQLWWNWELDYDRYPNWDGLTTRIDAAGGRTLCYINPFLVDITNNRPEPPRRDLYLEAITNGYVVLDQTGQPYPITNTDFDAALLDLTNPAAVTWFKQVIVDQVIGEAGCDGWMHDFAEALPFDAILFSGEPASSYHNQYPVDWAKLAAEVITEQGLESEIVFFNRAGYTQTPAYSTLIWEGDQTVTWDEFDGLQSAIIGMLTSGFSGISLNHSDVGGYTNVSLQNLGYNRGRELLYRWMEFAAFTTAYRTHEGLRPEFNAQFYDDAEALDMFDRFARVYAALQFYRVELFEQSADYGWPVVRHPMLHYPDETALIERNDQFLLGSEFLISAKVDPSVGNGWKDVTFPDAENTTWVHIWTCDQYGKFRDGEPTSLVQAPEGFPAVFYRQGSLAGEQFMSNLVDQGVLNNTCGTTYYLPLVLD